MATAFLEVANNAASLLAAEITATATTLSVAAGDGAEFPADTFHISIDNEIMLVTSRSTDVFTVTRGQEGTTGAVHLVGAEVRLNITAKNISDLNTAVNTLEALCPTAAVLEADFDAYTMLYADTDDTPVALTIAASRIVGRKASGGIAAMTGAEVIALLTGANLDVGAFNVRGQTLTADGLTSGRVIFAGASGVLSDNSNFTFATDTLTVTKIAAFEATGLVTSSSIRGYKTTATFSPNAARTNYAFSIGSRATELTVNLANSASQNLELFQMNVNLTASGGAPTSTSTVSLIRVRSTHDTVDMPNLRLRNINTYMDIKKSLQDAYGVIHGLDFYTNAITIGGEAAVGVFNIDANSAVTGKVRGIIINVYGAGLPAATSIGLEVRTNGGSATLGEGVRIWAVGSCSINYGLYIAGTINTADIRFSGGATLVDDGTNLTLAGSKLKVVAPDISGTVTATSALTMPTHTSGTITFNTGTVLQRDVDNEYVIIWGGGANAGARITLFGEDTGVPSQFDIRTRNAAKDADITRLTVSGAIDTAIATWGGITHTGLVLSGALTLNGQALDAGSGHLTVNSTGAWRGVHVIATNDGISGVRFLGWHISTSPAVNDSPLRIDAWGYDLDSPQNLAQYGYIDFLIEDASANAVYGKLAIVLGLNSGLNTALELSSAGVLAPDHSILFKRSQDSAAVADQVSLSGYEMSAGHRALAISSEEVVITEAPGAADRSYPVRINGVNYKMLLVVV